MCVCGMDSFSKKDTADNVWNINNVVIVVIDWCRMCKSEESVDHLGLHCEMASAL